MRASVDDVVDHELPETEDLGQAPADLIQADHRAQRKGAVAARLRASNFQRFCFILSVGSSGAGMSGRNR